MISFLSSAIYLHSPYSPYVSSSDKKNVSSVKSRSEFASDANTGTFTLAPATSGFKMTQSIFHLWTAYFRLCFYVY